MIFLLLSLLLATPNETDLAIQRYYLGLEHAQQRLDAVLKENAPPPPGPPPPGAEPRLLAVIRPGSTQALKEGVEGETLVVIGESLPTNGIIMMAHRQANVTRRADTFYEVIVPKVVLNSTLPRSGPLDLFIGSRHIHRLMSDFALVAAQSVVVRGKLTGPNLAGLKPGQTLTVTGAGITGTLVVSDVDSETTPPVPPPTPVGNLPGPHIGQVRGGTVGRERQPILGDLIVIQGLNFGTAKGRLWWGPAQIEVTPTLWTDTEVRFVLTAAAGELHPRGTTFLLRTAKGEGTMSGAFMR